MRMLVLVFLVTFTTAWGQSGKTEPISSSDSIDVKVKIEAFYNWYENLIRQHKLGTEFNPIFTSTKNGMTGLDFTKYEDGLRKHFFTENYIRRKIKDYSTCVANLAKVKYETFLTFTDLDQFEEIDCAFSNVNEWTADMESYEGAELIGLAKGQNSTIIGTVQFFDTDKEKKKYVWDHKVATVIFQLEDGQWKITNIEIERR